MKKVRLSKEDWKEIVALGPGVREYKGMQTLFYDGGKLWKGGKSRWEDIGPLIYTKRERRSWRAIIVLPGVKVIPDCTFFGCEAVEFVIMADTMRRIK